MPIGSWTPPRKYKGLRTQFVHAVKVTLPPFEQNYGRSLSAQANRNAIYVKIAEMEDWCEEICTRHWSSSGYTTWYFEKTTEAVLFKMTFGGR